MTLSSKFRHIVFSVAIICIFFFNFFFVIKSNASDNIERSYILNDEINVQNQVSCFSNFLTLNNIYFWKNYKSYYTALYNGYKQIIYMYDPVYQSMNLPSESQSDYMISVNRNKGKIIGNTSSPYTEKVLGFGGLYTTSGETLPNNFCVYLSKIKVFAFSKSAQKWIVIDSQPYPCGIYIFTLPWGNSKVTKCKNVTYTNNYAKVQLTKDEMENACLHFWGKSVPIKKDDYIYYACAYTFWVDSSAANKMTATNGVDAKDYTGDNTIIQLYSSRGISSSTSPKTIWGHTIPNENYFNCNGTSLNYLFIAR